MGKGKKVVLRKRPLNVKRVGFGDNIEVVLCKWGNEYATWLRNMENPKAFFSGHYFKTREAAERDFKERR